MPDRPRDWRLAGFLSLLAPGLGQIYNGEWAKALVLLAVTIPVAIFLVVLLFTPLFHLVTPIALLVALAVFVYSIVDAIAGARRQGQSYQLRPFNRVFVYVALILAFATAREGLALLLRESFIQAFRIPSEAMLPTLQVGDFLFVDKRPVARVPSRGDVIVHVDPHDPRRQYVKRVVALAGDRIEIRDKILSINDHAPEERYVVHIDPSVHPGEFDPRDNFGPYTVPRRSYFVLGDNRDNSNDSRFWGPVDAALVTGRVRGIYWSWDPQKRAPRWDRLGTLVR